MKRFSKLICVITSLIMLTALIPGLSLSSQAADGKWVGSWSTAPIKSGIQILNGNYTDYLTARTTVRSTITPTLSGNTIRLKFSNLYGSDTVYINETTIAVTGETDDEIDTSTLKQVTFNNGSKYANILPGNELYSDEIEFPVEALKKISISTYYENSTNLVTSGLSGGVSYTALGFGNKTHKKDLSSLATKLDLTSGTITYHTIPFLINLDVKRTDDAYSVVIIGDSTVTNDTYLFLATKLIKNGITNVGVLNESIIGNRVLYDGASALGNLYGYSLLSRFQKDALNQAGCKYIIVKEGLNDVLHPMAKSMKDIAPYASVDDIIGGYKTIAEQAHKSDKKIFIVTRTPYKGYTRDYFMSSDADLEWTQTGEDMLLDINRWITNYSSSYFDGYIDVDAMRDKTDPTKLMDQLTIDGAHLTSYGQIALADLLTPESYGQSGKTLTSLSSILNIDPYKASSTGSGNSNSNSNSGSNSISSSGISDFFKTATGALAGLLNQSDSGDSGSSDNSSGNSSSSSNSSTPNVITPSVNFDANAAAATQSGSSQSGSASNSTNSMVADLQNNGGNQTQNQQTAAGGLSVKQIMGVMLLSAVGILLVVAAMVVLYNKDSDAPSSLSRGVKKLRI